MKAARGKGETTTYIDRSPVVSPDGQQYPGSVRRIDCEIITESSSPYPRRCKPCQGLRSSLRSAISRCSHNNHIAASSRTNFVHLTPEQKDQRTRSLSQSLKLAKQQVRCLEEKVKQLIEKEGVSLQPNDSNDMSRIIADVTPHVEESFPPNSPQRIFWEQ